MHPNEIFMKEAIALANQAKALGEYPIGAVVVLDGKIIGSAYTSLDSQHDPSAHSEILALRAAANHAGSRYLKGAVLYTTLEPCPMCTAAAIWAKCDAVVFGATQEDAISAGQKSNNGKSFRQIRIKARYVAAHGDPILNIFEDFLREKCVDLIND
jgi:tRNA(Arg) A34 adenosine deaminase TadA